MLSLKTHWTSKLRRVAGRDAQSQALKLNAKVNPLGTSRELILHVPEVRRSADVPTRKDSSNANDAASKSVLIQFFDFPLYLTLYTNVPEPITNAALAQPFSSGAHNTCGRLDS